ncbi:DUF6126 family protein [Kitasatospora sp. NBC_00070]|uniref:DUF6126 family protein n=1 Tax=Kitasatospora sp. NBC_00070 TaxID=2975962 RepID=UPI0032525D0C
MSEAVRGEAIRSGAVSSEAVGSGAVRDEKSRRRQMLVRATFYIAGTHLFAGFVILLFALGNRH